MRALFVGRFQPFHKGHLAAVEHILQWCERKSGQVARPSGVPLDTSGRPEIILGVGSAQESHTAKNPLTAGERHLLVAGAMAAAGVRDRCFITSIPDIHNHGLWVAHVESLVPPFSVVFTNSRLDRRLFADRGYYMLPEFFQDRDTFTASEVRRRILTDGDWESLVPPAVARGLRDLDAIERIRHLPTAEQERPGA